MPEKGKAERNVEERRMFLEIKTIQREKERKKEREKRTMREEGKESVSLSLSLSQSPKQCQYFRRSRIALTFN